MNDDHADALVLYARVFAGLENVRAARMTDIDADVLTLEIDTGNGLERARISLAGCVASPPDARRVLIQMARAAREKVGGAP